MLQWLLGSSLALVIAAGCAGVPTPDAAASPQDGVAGDEPVVTVTSHGGRCVDGPCRSVITVLVDGTVVRDDGRRGAVDPARWAAIRREIATADWSRLLGRPFTGLCPTATDGTELIWRFRTAAGWVEAASCTVEIPYDTEPFRGLWPPLFEAGG